MSDTDNLEDQKLEDLAEDIDKALGVRENRDTIQSFIEDLENLESKTDNMRSNVKSTENKIRDTRRKVIEIAQKQNKKADAEHTHKSIVKDMEDIRNKIDDMESNIELKREEISSLNQRTETKSDRLDKINQKLETLAWKCVEIIEDLNYQESSIEDMDRSKIDEFRNVAQEKNVNKGRCENCGVKINISLLTEANCYECGSKFIDIKKRIIRSNIIE